MKKDRRIRSIEDLALIPQKEKVVTLFSGGLDSTYLLYLLSKNNHQGITALTIDLGDNVDRLALKRIASKFGARSVVIDCKTIFAKEAVLPAIAAQARYLGIYPISASLSRPIIAREAIQFARLHHSQVIIHTANQSQNSLRRLNGAFEKLSFDGYYGTPYEFSSLTRGEKESILKQYGLDKFEYKNYSGGSNLWCREFESGLLDDPENFQVSPSLYKWSIQDPSSKKISISISFESGIPIAIDGKSLEIIEIINLLNNIVGRYGLGRYAGLEHLDQGEKVLEIREMPATYLLIDAYRHLETAILGADTIKEKITIEQTWINEAVEGRWFSDLKLAAEAFIMSTSKKISGTITYQLSCYGAELCSIRANMPLYLRDRDAWEKKVSKVRCR